MNGAFRPLDRRDGGSARAFTPGMQADSPPTSSATGPEMPVEQGLKHPPAPIGQQESLLGELRYFLSESPSAFLKFMAFMSYIIFSFDLGMT